MLLFIPKINNHWAVTAVETVESLITLDLSIRIKLCEIDSLTDVLEKLAE